MNVPNEILENLKCSNCEDLLSCGPVQQKLDGSNICGRCSALKLEEPLVLNQPYNSLAQLCVFPCKYEAQGCTERRLFQSMKRHEADCEYRTYICPVLESGRCEWIGPRNRLLQHAQAKHPEHVLSHPAQMNTNVRVPGNKTFLMAAYDVLFLLYVKVCLATHTIYHNMRKLGGMYEYEYHTFKFFVNIENDTGCLKRKSGVGPQDSTVSPGDATIGIKINSMLEVLGGYNNLKFLISIEENMKCFICNKIVNSSDIGFCYSSTLFNRRMYYCKPCNLTVPSCINASEGCAWKGQNDNHKLVCSYTKTCPLCNKNISEFGSLLNHMQQKHKTCYFEGQFYTQLRDTQKVLIFPFKSQPFILMYNQSSFFVHGDFAQMKFHCILIIRNIISKRTSHYFMKRFCSSYYGQYYFNLELDDNKLEPFINDNQFEVGVDVY